MSVVPAQEHVLLVTAGVRLCALPLVYVSETLRPLACHAVPDAPPFVCGVATIRGVPTPVADLGLIIGASALAAPSRLVRLRLADSRSVALLVDTVQGVHRIDRQGTRPPLLRDSSVVQMLGRLDAELLTVLDCSCLLDDDEWQWFAQARAGS